MALIDQIADLRKRVAQLESALQADAAAAYARGKADAAQPVTNYAVHGKGFGETKFYCGLGVYEAVEQYIRDTSQISKAECAVYSPEGGLYVVTTINESDEPTTSFTVRTRRKISFEHRGNEADHDNPLPFHDADTAR